LECFVNREVADIEAESVRGSDEHPPRPENGLKQYWMTANAKSLDGLPGILSAHESTKSFKKSDAVFRKDDERVRTEYEGLLDGFVDRKAVMGFALGVLASILYARSRQT